MPRPTTKAMLLAESQKEHEASGYMQFRADVAPKKVTAISAAAPPTR